MTGPLGRLRTYFAGYGGRLAIAIACLVGRACALTLLVLILRRIVERFTHGAGLREAIGDAALALLVAATAGLLTLRARSWITVDVKRGIAALRCDLLGAVHRWPIDRIEREGRTAIHMRIVHDTELLDRMVHGALSGMAPAVIALIALAAAMLWIAPILGIAALVILAIGWIPGQAVRAGTLDWNRRFRDAYEDFSRSVLVMLERSELARMSGVDRKDVAHSSRRVEDVRAISTHMVNRAAVVAEMHSMIGNAALLILLLMGGVAMQAGMVSTPNLVAMFAVLILARAQIGAITMSMPAIQEGRASIDRLWPATHEEGPVETPSRSPVPFHGAIELRDVHFSYGSRPLLRGVDLAIKPGTCMLIAGDNGTGKSTLVRIMLGLCRPQTGKVMADGAELQELDLAALRNQIGVVPQQAALFEGSIAENVAFAHPEASITQIDQALALVGADDFISHLPAGRDTPINDKGELFSGGERQRVALARALLGEPRLLILDEPFNHLSAEALGIILQRLRDLPHKPGIVLISHDGAAVALVDEHYRLKDGKVVRQPQPADAVGAAA